MCKIGEIIGVPTFYGETNMLCDFHYFIVVGDYDGQIEGLDFTKVGSMMCSLDGKSENYKKKKLKYKENIPIDVTDFSLGKRIRKKGFIKSDQLHYFNKKKTKYFSVGMASNEILNRLFDNLETFDKNGTLKHNINNLY